MPFITLSNCMFITVGLVRGGGGPPLGSWIYTVCVTCGCTCVGRSDSCVTRLSAHVSVGATDISCA